MRQQSELVAGRKYIHPHYDGSHYLAVNGHREQPILINMNAFSVCGNNLDWNLSDIFLQDLLECDDNWQVKNPFIGVVELTTTKVKEGEYAVFFSNKILDNCFKVIIINRCGQQVYLLLEISTNELCLFDINRWHSYVFQHCGELQNNYKVTFATYA